MFILLWMGMGRYKYVILLSILVSVIYSDREKSLKVFCNYKLLFNKIIPSYGSVTEINLQFKENKKV